jgi:hypothetical protein
MLGETGIRSIISRSLAAELSTISCTKYQVQCTMIFFKTRIPTLYLVLSSWYNLDTRYLLLS